ncbi:MAG: ATP-binding protein [Calditrichaeota bacterium]|nr:MAG: ATP-binding protein [Calditrichota bacterium]
MKAKIEKKDDEKSNLLVSLRKYHFELKHIMVLFIIVVSAQVLISYTHKTSLQKFLTQTQESYQRDSSERLSNLTATALELILTTSSSRQSHIPEERQKIIEAFNIILSQQLLVQGVEKICVLAADGDQITTIESGQLLYDYFLGDSTTLRITDVQNEKAISIYSGHENELKQKELIISQLEGKRTFHVLVPFVPKGEFAGALYMQNTPDFTFITDEIISSYNESSMIFSGLIIFGFLAMFLISSYTLSERNQAQEQLYKQREQQLKERIDFQKEALFTKRIYHTHHKAEKVMGFIKEDLYALGKQNIEEIRGRVVKYANFISRVIYDMKWYDPPLQTIRNPIFRTDINNVIRFIVDNICLRTTKDATPHKYKLELDENLPPVHINEFVVWEILEPLFQNSMDHNPDSVLSITVKTVHLSAQKKSQIIISDDGVGFPDELLLKNEAGLKKIFLENVSTKENENNAGYGCYLAYEISKQRCGWQLDAENLPDGGCRFILTIQN